MDIRQTNSAQLEPMYKAHHNLLCWKSVFAGVLISVMGFMILTALGAGVGGLTASNMIANEQGGWGLATGAGLWLGISTVISLFLGSYFTLRISKYVTNKVGAAHGFVVASIFFILMIWGAGSTLGGMTSGLGKMIGSLGHGAADISSNPAVQDTVQKALGGATLKSDPQVVVQGLAVRLLQGDTDSVKSYYAYQTGLSQADVDAQVTQLKTDFDQKVKLLGEKTAHGVADAGWSLFVTFLVGLAGAVIGGRIGAHANVDRPFAKVEPEVYEQAIPLRA